MVKTVGCKVPVELYLKINNEICKIGKTKSQFLRMLINNYFKDDRLDENNQVNQSETQVNQIFYEDEYRTTKKEVDSFLKDLNKNMKK